VQSVEASTYAYHALATGHALLATCYRRDSREKGGKQKGQRQGGMGGGMGGSNPNPNLNPNPHPHPNPNPNPHQAAWAA
jgi:hypothetical protein